MRIEEYKSFFNLNKLYSISDIKDILLDHGFAKNEISVEEYNIFVKTSYKDKILCINLSLPIVDEVYRIKSIYFIPIAIHLANINNPYDYFVRK